MREQLKQSLLLSGVEVNEEDLIYLEVQLQAIQQTAIPFKKYQLQEIVPATIFRAEVEE